MKVVQPSREYVEKSTRRVRVVQICGSAKTISKEYIWSP
jgi:hypothetical protein